VASRGVVALHDEWHGELASLRAVEAERELTPQELDRLGHAAYGAGELETALTAWERLHAGHVAAGEHVAAARTAATIAMYLMMDTGLMAPVRGWAARAERLLEGQPEGPVHAWYAMVRTYERFMSGDLDLAGDWAERAIDVGTRHGAAEPVAVASVARARLRILDGDVDDGLALLDEAAVELLSGRLDPLAVGMVYCELICAMQGLAQYDRAEEWTDAMERWRHGRAFGGFNGRCRVHRAEILRLRGSCDLAEEEALHACEELRPWMRREYGWPLTELGTIRLRKGDLAGAEEAFLAAHEHGWDPAPGLALLRLAQGDVAEASALVAAALDRPAPVPSKERPPVGGLTRAPVLDAQVEIAVAAGDLATARHAAEELATIATTFRSAALAAAAALARARVALAEEEVASALDRAREAVERWSDVGAPYETATARLVLAEAHRRQGDDDGALLELGSARATFERIGARGRAAEAARIEEVTRAGGTEATAATLAGGMASPAVFRLDGDTRTVSFDGREVLLRDLKGMRYLARVLAEPGREFHVLDLVAAENGAPLVPPPAGATSQLPVAPDTDAGPVIDDTARDAYRRRLEETAQACGWCGAGVQASASMACWPAWYERTSAPDSTWSKPSSSSP
jgi:tetratricopeptide (TPR) repeat protein